MRAGHVNPRKYWLCSTIFSVLIFPLTHAWMSVVRREASLTKSPLTSDGQLALILTRERSGVPFDPPKAKILDLRSPAGIFSHFQITVLMSLSVPRSMNMSSTSQVSPGKYGEFSAQVQSAFLVGPTAWLSWRNITGYLYSPGLPGRFPIYICGSSSVEITTMPIPFSIGKSAIYGGLFSSTTIR